MQLNNKHALITGASGGIGLHIVEALAEKGVRLIITSRDAEKLENLAQGIRDKGGFCQSIVADLATQEGLDKIERAIRRVGELDLVINNAGISDFDTFENTEDEALERLIKINLISPMQLTKRVIPYLKNAERGLIVNIGSTFGSIGFPGFVNYCTSKFGFRGFTEALSRELSDTNIGVLYVAPRATNTGINSQLVNSMNDALGVKSDLPEWVAEQVINAIQKEHHRVYLGWPEKLFVRLNAVLPGLVASSIIKQLPVIRHYLSLRSGTSPR